MSTKLRELAKILILASWFIFSVLKGNFVNVGLVPWFFWNHGINSGCIVLIVVTLFLTFVQLKFYDKLSKSFLNSDKAVSNILSGQPETHLQSVLSFIILLVKEKRFTEGEGNFQTRFALINSMRFFGRFCLLVFMVTIVDPFIATAFFRDLKVFNWSQSLIFVVSLIIGTMTTLHLILGVWATI